MTISRFNEKAAEASRAVHHANTGTVRALTRNRPTLTAETAVEYLDWIAENLPALGVHAANHMAIAELAIRSQGNEAQGKATQHTLVQDGILPVTQHRTIPQERLRDPSYEGGEVKVS